MSEHDWVYLGTILFVYFFPAIVAGYRGCKASTAIFVVNLLCAWTGVLWLVALIWALAGRTKADDERMAKLNEQAMTNALRAAQQANAPSNAPLVRLF